MSKISGKKGLVKDDWFHPPIVGKWMTKKIRELVQEFGRAREIENAIKELRVFKVDRFAKFINDEWTLPKWEDEMAVKGSDTPLMGIIEGEGKKPHDVHIIPMDNGFVINIGCAHFVETSWTRISKALELYWKDPETARKKYWKKR